MLPWRGEFLATCLLFRIFHYWGNVTGGFRRHILRNQQTTRLNAQLCPIIIVISVGSHLS